MIETTRLCILMTVWMTLAFIQGHNWVFFKKGGGGGVGIRFLVNLSIDLNDIQCVGAT